MRVHKIVKKPTLIIKVKETSLPEKLGKKEEQLEQDKKKLNSLFK